jgi:hypothetical protein
MSTAPNLNGAIKPVLHHQTGNSTPPAVKNAPPAAIPTSDHQIEDAVKEFQLFISFIFTISIFGASLFAIIAGQMADPVDIWKPSPPPFTLQTVRTLLAASWLCFVLAIAIAGYSSSYLTIMRQAARSKYDEVWRRKWDRVGIACSITLHFLMIAAFMCISVSLVSYAGVVGWVAVGFTSLAGIFVVALSVYQARKSL